MEAINLSDNYVGAPYNFIPFSKKVIEYPKEKRTKHNEISENLISGEIKYKITAQTPIIIDSGNEQGNFHKNTRGNYSIPGSTIRGLIRNNVQILGFSSFYDDIDDYALMYRNVANGAERIKYNKILGSDQIAVDDENPNNKISILKNVKAGYISKKDGNYYILQTKVDKISEKFAEMNYYILSSKTILNHAKDYPFFTSKPEERMMYKMNCQFERVEYIKVRIKENTHFSRKITLRYKTEDKKELEKYINRDHLFSFEYDKINSKFISKIGYLGEYKNTAKIEGNKYAVQVHYIPKKKNMENTNYKPYQEEISYELANNRIVIHVGEPGEYTNKGYVISSGKMNEKKVLYIIPEVDEQKNPISISEKDINSFKIDIKKRKTTLKQFGGQEFFDLPEKEGEIKPVFYIELNGKLYFGFTPRLRLFYNYTIKQGLHKAHQPKMLDYSKAMFGYSNEEESYKSKISFSDAVVEGTCTELSERGFILSEPKPTSYLDYLKNDENSTLTYNNEDFELRGIKQYWLHHKEIAGQNVNNIDTRTSFRPLDIGTCFVGKVRFQNLHLDELGLLLWSIQLETNSRMNVGKAKAFGYGNISMEILSAKQIDIKKAYQTNELVLEPWKDIDILSMIQKYKDRINNEITPEQRMHIKNFFDMKDSTKIPDKELIRYMSIDAKEYQNRKKALPAIEEILL